MIRSVHIGAVITLLLVIARAREAALARLVALIARS